MYLFFINCKNNNFICSFCCTTTDTRQQIQLANKKKTTEKQSNYIIYSCRNALWESVILSNIVTLDVPCITDLIKQNLNDQDYLI